MNVGNADAAPDEADLCGSPEWSFQSRLITTKGQIRPEHRTPVVAKCCFGSSLASRVNSVSVLDVARVCALPVVELLR